MRYMSYVGAYVMYVDGGRGTIVMLLHDIGMCQELKLHCSRELYMCFINYTSGCQMLYNYLIVILNIIYVECCLHDETLFLILD